MSVSVTYCVSAVHTHGRYFDSFADLWMELWTDSRRKWWSSAYLCWAHQRGTGPMPMLAISRQTQPTPSVWSRSNAARETDGTSTGRLSQCRQSQSRRGDDRLMERSPEQPSSVFLPGTPHTGLKEYSLQAAVDIRLYTVAQKHPSRKTSTSRQRFRILF